MSIPSPQLTRLAAITLIAALVIASGASAERLMELAITTHLGDAQTFREGDLVSFHASLGEDAYLTLAYQDAGGNLQLIFPNALHSNNFFKAGWFIPVPNEKNPFQFRVSPPFGKETLWAFACDKPLPIAAIEAQVRGGLGSLRATFKSLCLRNAEASLTIMTQAGASGP